MSNERAERVNCSLPDEEYTKIIYFWDNSLWCSIFKAIKQFTFFEAVWALKDACNVKISFQNLMKKESNSYEFRVLRCKVCVHTQEKYHHEKFGLFAKDMVTKYKNRYLSCGKIDNCEKNSFTTLWRFSICKHFELKCNTLTSK